MLQVLVGQTVSLSSTSLFDHPTARQISDHLKEEVDCLGSVPAAAQTASSVSSNADQEVVLAGMSVALASGVSGLAALCVMSHCGSDLVSQIPAVRWSVEAVNFEVEGFPSEVASRVRHGSFLREAQLFDSPFFAISVAEAAVMDPQQRLLLERGYMALHQTGWTKPSLRGSVVAVNIGQWASEYGSMLLTSPARRSVFASTAFQCSVSCGRVSFVLGVQGPCASYDTACSSSLVASHGSMRALQHNECEAALSAGVNMILDPSLMRGNAIAGFTSVKGRSHTFDSRADGYARGEAVDVILCELGQDDSDRGMLAVSTEPPVAVGGSAVRQDGRSASLTAPNGQAQRAVIGAALVSARIAADDMHILEAHGTGTALGDPIETRALAGIFLVPKGETRDAFVVGSLKANEGHAEPGAGLAGALKLLMQLRGKFDSPNAQLRVLSPYVEGALGPLTESCRLSTQVDSLATGDTGGVSSFGYAGTVAHLVLAPGNGEGEGARTMYEAANILFDVQAPMCRRGMPAHRRAMLWSELPHPFAQERLSTSLGTVLLRSPAHGALCAAVAGHVVQSLVVFPGAAYLEMARAGASAVVSHSQGAGLGGIFFLQPLVVGARDVDVHCRLIDTTFEIRSGGGGGFGPLEGRAALHCSGVLRSDDHPWKHADLPLLRGSLCARAVDVGALYDNFYRVGLQYGPSYRLLVQAWGSEDGAVGLLRTRPEKQGTQVHPADLDDALCTGALTSGSGRDLETRLPFAVEDTLLQGTVGKLWTVCHLLA